MHRDLIKLVGLTTLVALIGGCAPLANQHILREEEEAEQQSSPIIEEPIPAPSHEVDEMEPPELSETQEQLTLAKYSFVDPDRTVPSDLLRDALLYYENNRGKLKNPSYLSIVDFAKYNGTKRFHIIDMRSGAVWSTYTAHGKNSDPNLTGFATSFSNTPGSRKSSLGMYLAAETYSGKHGRSLRLDGLSPSNSKARARAIVLHTAGYVKDEPRLQGRSDGCFVVPANARDKLINQISGGSLLYAGLSSKTPTREPASPSPSDKAAHPALWETKANPERKAWTDFAYDIVQQYGTNLIGGSNDVANFCPKYKSLNANQKITFWVHLVSAMAKYESGFKPTTRYLESTMGIDPITKQQVYSEGLLQLSYQDVRPYPFCNEFNWDTDKVLPTNDPKRTILDPYKNLKCGIRILNQQIARRNLIATPKGVYWSVLNPNGRHTKVPVIQELTKKIPFCK